MGFVGVLVWVQPLGREAIAITALATTIAPSSPCLAEPPVPPSPPSRLEGVPANPEKLGPHREPYAGV